MENENKVNTGQLLKNARKLKLVNASIIEHKLKLSKVATSKAENDNDRLLWVSDLEQLLKLRHYLRVKITTLVICDPFDDFLDNLFDWTQIKVDKPDRLPRTFKSYELLKSKS